MTPVSRDVEVVVVVVVVLVVVVVVVVVAVVVFACMRNPTTCFFAMLAKLS